MDLEDTCNKTSRVKLWAGLGSQLSEVTQLIPRSPDPKPYHARRTNKIGPGTDSLLECTLQMQESMLRLVFQSYGGCTVTIGGHGQGIEKKMTPSCLVSS